MSISCTKAFLLSESQGLRVRVVDRSIKKQDSKNRASRSPCHHSIPTKSPLSISIDYYSFPSLPPTTRIFLHARQANKNWFGRNSISCIRHMQPQLPQRLTGCPRKVDRCNMQRTKLQVLLSLMQRACLSFHFIRCQQVLPCKN